MTTVQFIRKFAADWGVTIEDAEAWIRPMLETLGEQLVKNDELKLTNVGIFRHVCTAPKVGRNMNTGERVDIPSRMQLEYRPTDRIDEAMRALPVNLELTKAATQKHKQEKKVPKRVTKPDDSASDEAE